MDFAKVDAFITPPWVTVWIPRTGYSGPGRDAPRARPNGESSWQTVAAAAVAVASVTWMGMIQIQRFRPNLDLNLTKYEQKCYFFKIRMSYKSKKSYFQKIKGPTWTQALPSILPPQN